MPPAPRSRTFPSFCCKSDVKFRKSKSWRASDLLVVKVSAQSDAWRSKKRRKTETKILQTLTGRLPLKQSPYSRQILARHVSDYPQHFIFRRPNIFFFGFFGLGNQLRTLTRDRHPPLLGSFEFGFPRALTGFVFLF